ncbi:MAG TPA: chemotaxis protein CheB [Thermoanaerobaculia bacterium]|nr:chemotaxis protein CheB [Thermoanaerobaculia bacterium]
MPRTDIIVIGASAGGIDAIRTILGGLPEDFPGSLLVVVHTSPDSPGVLDVIFNSAGALPAVTARDGERIAPGHVYVAPPDHHLLIEPGRMCLTRGPKENRFRPAVDPLFRSAAQTYGPRVAGIILSGGLDDGTSGLRTVKQMGGTAIVQDPREAWAPSMPQSALQHVRADHVLPVGEIAALLVRLAAGADDVAEGGGVVPEEVKIEVEIAKANKATEAGVLKLGDPSIYACPECHGVLLEMKDHAPLRFRCHTGHGYTIESLASEMDDMIEDALWSAIRALEERAMLMRRTGDDRYLPRAEDAQRRAALVRQALFDPEPAKTASGG